MSDDTKAPKNGTTRERYQAFVDNLLVSFNLTEAAKAAGYSERSAHAQGSRLLKNAEVQKLLKAGRKKLLKRAEINRDIVVARLKALMNSNVQIVLGTTRTKPDGSPVDPSVNPEMPNDTKGIIARIRSLPWEKAYAIDSVKIKDTPFGTNVSFKMRRPDQSLQMLAMHLGLLDGSGTDGQSDQLKTALAALDEEEKGE